MSLIQISRTALGNLAQRAGARMVVVITMAGDSFAVGSHGRRASEERDSKRLGDRIAAMLKDGELAHFQAATAGSDFQGSAARIEKLASLLSQVTSGHGGETCPFGDAPCVRCRVAREWAAYERGAQEKPSGPKRKRCIEDGCRRMAKAPGPFCILCRQAHREAAGLDQRTS